MVLIAKCRSSRRCLCLFIAFFLVHCYPGPPYFPPIRAAQPPCFPPMRADKQLHWAAKIGTGIGPNRTVETPFSGRQTKEWVPKMPKIISKSSKTRSALGSLSDANDTVVPPLGHQSNVPPSKGAATKSHTVAVAATTPCEATPPKWDGVQQLLYQDGFNRKTATVILQPGTVAASTVSTVSEDGAVLDEPRGFGGGTPSTTLPWAKNKM